jgi:alkanesulfonate monooxygenase SsuD/methylene tetrahydromethanopterin reductase-like flavin-dependent oxidoreductase (luciferase family)
LRCRLGAFEIGLVLTTAQTGPERTTPRWADLQAIALTAEGMGFDTIWSPDELLWRPQDKPQIGVWEGIAVAAAVAAVTSRIKVGTWVISALHRNAGITAKAVETLDEISGGRFVFGLGAGHAWPGQARAFGLPEDKIFDRFEEALQIIVPLLREGHADFEGQYHSARDLDQVPRGPRPGRIPLMIGALGPRGLRLVARYADIWSCYGEKRTDVVELGPRIAEFEAACAEVGRDPATIGRSAGIYLEALKTEANPTGATIAGSPEEIANAIRALRDAGFTQVELWLHDFSIAAVDRLAPVLDLLRGDAG